MLTLFTMEEGKTIVDLFTPENMAAWEAIEEEVLADPGVQSVVTPRAALEFTQRMVTMTPDGEVTDDATASVAGQALLGARERETSDAAMQVRLDDALTTLERLNAVPPEERVFENRDWVQFLLTDNRGEIRKALRPFFPDDTHAQLVTRLTGHAAIEEEGRASEIVVRSEESRVGKECGSRGRSRWAPDH